MATFGNTSSTGTLELNQKFYLAGSRFVLAEAALISKLTARFDNLGLDHNACNQRAVIYTEGTNSPATRVALGESTAVADSAPLAWYDLPFASPVRLAPGMYWIMVIGDDSAEGVETARDLSTGYGGYSSGSTSYTSPEDNPAMGLNAVRNYCIYATYEPVPGIVRRNLLEHPSFELDDNFDGRASGFSRWSGYTVAPTYTLSAGRLSGYSQRFQYTVQAGDSANLKHQFTNSTVTDIYVTPASPITLSAYFKGSVTGCTAYLRLEFTDADDEYVSAHSGSPITLTSSFAQSYITTTVPAGAVFADALITIGSASAGDTIDLYVDDAQVELTDTLGTYGDGDTVGWQWAGEKDNSESYMVAAGIWHPYDYDNSVVTDGLVAEYVAKLANTGAAPGNNTDPTSTWTDLIGSNDMALDGGHGFDFSATDGWGGTGSSSDPYCLINDGVNHCGYYAVPAGVGSGHDFTVELWAWLASTGSNTFLLSSYSTNEGIKFYFQDSNGEARWVVGYGTSETYSYDGQTDSVTQVWRHCVITYNAATNQAYVYENGVANSHNPYSTSYSPYTSGWLFLGYPASTQSSSKVPSLRYYDRALTAKEVLQNYNAGTTASSLDDYATPGIVHSGDWLAPHEITAGATTNGLAPVGAVVPYSGLLANIPAGWKFCNGDSLLRAGTYADLYTAIGTVYGSADGTHFSLPDLRDKFLVGANQDSSSLPKSTITGALAQSYTRTPAATLTHSMTVADHTLAHTGFSVAGHPDLTHAALGIDDHPAIASTNMGISVASHPVGVHSSVVTSTGAAITMVTSFTATHTWTGPSCAAITHSITMPTHTSTAMTHATTQATSHSGAAVTHSFTVPSQHTLSTTELIPAFLSLGYMIRYA